MKWNIWLDELKTLPAEATEWDDYISFVEEVARLSESKLQERAQGQAKLGQVLEELLARHGATLTRFGLNGLEEWRLADCPPAQTSTVVSRIEGLTETLEQYEELLQKTLAQPVDFYEFRLLRNDLEDKIFLCCAPVAAIFAPAQTFPQIEAALELPALPAAPSQESEVTEESAEELPSNTNAIPEIVTLAPLALPSPNVDEEVNPTESLPVPLHGSNGVSGSLTVISQQDAEIIAHEEALHDEAEKLFDKEEAETPILDADGETSAHILPQSDNTGVSVQEVAIEKVAARAEIQPSAEESTPPAESSPKRLQIFISSPGDVGQERLIATRVVERLQGEFAAFVELVPILWEHEPLRATSHFQEQIIPPSSTDIVICILWSRLGTRLPEQFRRSDGTLYSSGTEWEFEDALASFQERGTPDLMVYRKSSEPLASMSDEEALLGRLAQKKALDTFIDRWFGNAQETFKAAFHNFPTPDEFERLLESHLRKLIKERLPKFSSDAEEGTFAIRWHKGSPYRGLEAFDMEHAPIFFGRTRAIGEIRDALVRHAAQGCSFLMIFGMSGSGKSSLVRAGVLPTLTQPGVVEGVALWRWSIFKPSDASDDLLYGLALALLEPKALPEIGMDAAELAALLREAPQRAVSSLHAALEKAALATQEQEQLASVPAARLALLVDQFEEIFTLDWLGAEERQTFVAVLSVLACSGLISIIATMRSDFYARCAEIPDLVKLKEGSGQYHLVPPTFAEIGQILIQPTRAAGLRFEVDPISGERLSDVLHDAAGKNPGALPLLQFTLDELFKSRTEKGVLTFEAYRQLGGLEGALAERAEAVFQSLSKAAQAELPGVLRALVTVDTERDSLIAARRVMINSVVTNEARRTLIKAFIDARLLVVDEAEGTGATAAEPVIRVAHEALLRHWPRLQEWLVGDIDFLRARTRITAEVTHWQTEDKRPDFLLREGMPLAEAENMISLRLTDLDSDTIEYIQASRQRVRRARRQKWTIISSVLATFFLMIAGFGTFSYLQWQKTAVQKKLALDAIGKWTYEIPDKLADVPESRPIIKAIFEENIALLDRILAMDSQTPTARREQAVNLQRIGDTWQTLGDLSQSRAAYQKSLAITEELSKNKPTPGAWRDLATNYEKMGESYQATDELQKAKDFFAKSLAIRTDLARGDFAPTAQRDLSVSLEKMGDVRQLLKDDKGAAQAYAQAWDIRAVLAQDKENTQAQRDLLVTAMKSGDVQFDQKVYDKARKAYDLALPLATELVKRAHKDGTATAEPLRDLSAVYDRIGELQLAQNQTDAAIKTFHKSLNIALELAKDKSNAEAQHDLSTSWNRLGVLALSQGKIAASLPLFAKSLPLLENLAKDKGNLQVQQELLEIYANIGDAQLSLGNLLPARAAYRKSLEQFELLKNTPVKDQVQPQAASALGQMAYLEVLYHRPKEAISDASRGLAMAPDQSWIAVNLVHGYLFNDQLDKAIALCRQNKQTKVHGKRFFDVILSDLQQFAANGLVPPDSATFKQWLAKNQKEQK